MSSDKEVSDKVELHLIDTRELVEQAKKIRELEALSDKKKKVTKELKTSSKSPLSAFDTEQSVQASIIGAPFGKTAPKGFFTGGEQTFKTAVSGARTENTFTESQKKQQELEDHISQFEKKLNDIKKEQKDFETKMIGNAKSLQTVLSPAGYKSNVSNLLLNKLGVYGIVGSIVLAAGTEIIGEVEDQFAAGGVFNTKLKVPPQALTLNNVDQQNEFKAGTKYITSDLRVQQKSPLTSNTSNLSYENIRYAMDNLGR